MDSLGLQPHDVAYSGEGRFRPECSWCERMTGSLEPGAAPITAE